MPILIAVKVLLAFLPLVHQAAGSHESFSSVEEVVPGLLVCPLGWHSYTPEQVCFKVHGVPEYSWREAVGRCDQDGGHLAIFPSQEVREFVMTEVYPQSGLVDIWIGARREQGIGEPFRWLDGSLLVRLCSWGYNECSLKGALHPCTSQWALRYCCVLS